MQKQTPKMVKIDPKVTKIDPKSTSNRPQIDPKTLFLVPPKATEFDGKTKLPDYVVEREGKWLVRIQVRKADGSGYAPIKRTCREKTQTEVDRLVAEIRASVRLSELPEAEPDETVEQFLERYLNLQKRTWASTTYETKSGYFHRHIKGTLFAMQPITDVRPISKIVGETKSVQGFYVDLQDMRGRSGTTVREVHRFLSVAFNQAIAWSEIPSNPCRGVKLPKAKKTKILVLDDKEARAFIGVCKTKMDYVPLHFALATSTRPEEWLAIAWKDVDLSKKEIHIRRAMVRTKKASFEIKETKTEASNRTIKITNGLCDRLSALRVHQDTWIAKLKKTRKKEAKETLENIEKYDLVFPNRSGEPLDRHNLCNRLVKNVAIEAKIKKRISLYSLRHTGATLALAGAANIKGANMKVVAEHLGHTDTRMLFKHYAHVLPNMRDEMTEVLAGVLND